MKRLGLVVAGALASVMVSGAALAADFGPIVLPATPPAVPLATPPGFSFAGPYVGAFGGLLVGNAFQAGIQGGFNFVRGHFLVGAEAQVAAVFPSVGFEGDLNARLGVVLGERVLVYGEGGIGIFRGTPIYTAGGGVEIGVVQSLSIFAEAKAVGALGQPFETFQVQGGINWHPNY
jgi:hypothetical protein